MLKKLMTSAAISALMISGAMAQASPPASPPAKADAAPLSDAKFLSSQNAEHWVFSKFKGTDVLGPDNVQVGDVNDILFDRNGKVIGMIVGVGGFLGIGEKAVAIDMSAFQAVPASTGTSTSAVGAASADADPTNVKLKVSWTKEQLKNAPDFQYYKPAASARTSDKPGASPTTGMAPRPATPER
jgi:sporulation protein YlmC with PRC-barrel domain